MPQLDPSPWFLILIVSWLTLVIFMPIKTAKYQQLNDPTPKLHKGLAKSWHWPWP
uniref:ATP synthase complex subunit 8 n=1 Tax=Pseudis tocantins TaxID=428384 RepID=A0A411NHF2_9NEOB|nr:ATP synthase F0 subunit 8 [Pseudis tocantins]QBF44120.1 ATP synthase F0 subunit 8 [Pseudis tocantins]